MGTRGTIGIASLVLLLAVTVSPRSARSAGSRPDRDPPLPGCGICYPGGYDLNTLGTVQGKLLDLRLPDDGPVRFTVDVGRDRWVVLVSPKWF